MSDAALSTWVSAFAPHGRAGRLLALRRPPASIATALWASALLVAAMVPAAFVWHPRAVAPGAVEASRRPALPPPPLWIDVPRPIHIYSLEAPVLKSVPLVYSARRRSSGAGREDMLAFGAPGVDAPALRLRLVRRLDAGDPPAPLFAAVAGQAAEAGLAVERIGLADLMSTRFGKFEIAEVTLADAARRHVPCSGFRLVLGAPRLTVSGLACGSDDKPLARGALACLLDRLDLASGGEDRALIDFFAASERRRDLACDGARLAPDTLHAAWLDDKPATPRRSSHRH